ncbi:MAG: mechanosensitive ion channel protein MscS [Acidobacteria bacterium]|nr:MAG: mechanosensitive ion channel protein MscS [Acidobacteriota bacterium]
MEQLSAYKDDFIKLAMVYLPKVLLAVVTILVGLFIIKLISRFIGKAFERAKVEQSLGNFLRSGIEVLLKVLLLFSAASMVGIQTTSFVALLGALAFAVGMALQGSLSNFAGGVLILLFKPFKAGDLIEAQGFLGTVDSIVVFNTILKTVDNKRVIIPNGALSSGPITNYSSEKLRRVDMVFGIGYDDDIKKAKQVLAKLVSADERILKDPAPFIGVGELADSSVNIKCRVWVKSADYWPVHADTLETVKLTFDKEGISIPFPQRDVHMHQVEND